MRSGRFLCSWMMDFDDEEDNGDEGRISFATGKCFFKQKDAHSMLSSLMYDDESSERSKEIYDY